MFSCFTKYSAVRTGIPSEFCGTKCSNPRYTGYNWTTEWLGIPIKIEQEGSQGLSISLILHDMTTNPKSEQVNVPAGSKSQLELDPSLLKLDNKERQFFKDQTGITDDEALDQHIIEVQAKAWKVSVSWCHQTSLRH